MRLRLGVLSFVVLLVGWELLARLHWVNPFFTSQPTAIAEALTRAARSGELVRNIAVSLAEFFLGYFAASVIGVLTGLIAGRIPVFEYALEPFLVFIYSAPLIAFYPLFVIWFGLGGRTVVAITFLLAVAPITANTLSGMKAVNPALIRAARSFGAKEQDVLWKVVIPASVPMIMAGLRLGIGRALTGVVVSELFGATAGLGFSMAYYGGLLKTADMLASLWVIVVLGVICTQGLSAIEAHFDSWRT